jgi:hypothetical protein
MKSKVLNSFANGLGEEMLSNSGSGTISDGKFESMLTPSPE